VGPRAFLDASVLFSVALTDLFLRIATEELFDPLWSPDVEAEWTRRLQEKRPDLKKERIQRRASVMREHFSRAVVSREEYLPYLSAIELPDPNDRHVVAAAFAGGAEVLVTYNLKDFPEEALAPFELEPMHPDAFLTDLLEADIRQNGQPTRVLRALQALHSALQKPPNPEAWISSLEEKHELRAFGKALRSFLGQI
jgi:predicted nucleic acid-binding protein